MNLRNLFTTIALAASLSIVSIASAITYDATTMGTSAPAGVSFVPSGGALGLKSQAGYQFLGVTGGSAGNEIDIGQSLTINFAAPQVVTELIIGLLFDGPEYGDPNERALVTITPGSSTFSLTATGTTTAAWTGLGSVVNLSPATLGLGAVWKLINPFGTTAVSSIVLYPDASVKGSDFGLVGFKTHAVPDAATTLGLLGVSLLGLACFRRHLRN